MMKTAATLLGSVGLAAAQTLSAGDTLSADDAASLRIYEGTSHQGQQPLTCTHEGKVHTIYCGIIDFLQPWVFGKKVAKVIKSLEFNKATEPPPLCRSSRARARSCEQASHSAPCHALCVVLAISFPHHHEHCTTRYHSPLITSHSIHDSPPSITSHGLF